MKLRGGYQGVTLGDIYRLAETGVDSKCWQRASGRRRRSKRVLSTLYCVDERCLCSTCRVACLTLVSQTVPVCHAVCFIHRLLVSDRSRLAPGQCCRAGGVWADNRHAGGRLAPCNIREMAFIQPQPGGRMADTSALRSGPCANSHCLGLRIALPCLASPACRTSSIYTCLTVTTVLRSRPRPRHRG